MRRLSLFVLVFLSGVAVAQTYRWVDPATGKTMITDTPPPGNVKQINRTKAPEEGDGLSFATRKATENFPVTLYTSADCVAECKQARDLLNKRGVPFSERMLTKKEDFEELKTLVGDAFVPSLKVGKQTVRGFQAEGFNNLLDLAGYPTSAAYGSKPSGGLAK
jgi:glutaredoxin